MMIKQDFCTLPPKIYLMQLLSKEAKTYVYLWDRKDTANRLNLTWPDITLTYNRNSFRSCMRRLNNEGLLSYEESDAGVTIELVGWADEGEN